MRTHVFSTGSTDRYDMTTRSLTIDCMRHVQLIWNVAGPLSTGSPIRWAPINLSCISGTTPILLASGYVLNVPSRLSIHPNRSIYTGPDTL